VEDDARPVIFYPRGAVCRSPLVKGLTLMVNSIYNGQRFEDLWLDRRRRPVHRANRASCDGCARDIARPHYVRSPAPRPASAAVYERQVLLD
jgi:hypothetical protein